MKTTLIISYLLILIGCNSRSAEQSKISSGKLDTTIGNVGMESQLSKKDKRLDINDTCESCEGYMAPLGNSSNGKYKAYEYGTSACGRGFQIYTTDNKLVKESGYYSCVEDKNQLKWIGNKIYYYIDCNKSTSLPKDLPKLKEQEIYVQKYYWTNGKDSIANEFTVAGVE